jgi:hypothetical protein
MKSGDRDIKGWQAMKSAASHGTNHTVTISIAKQGVF